MIKFKIIKTLSIEAFDTRFNNWNYDFFQLIYYCGKMSTLR